jgi:Ca2+-binding EF-hand superfamily protein
MPPPHGNAGNHVSASAFLAARREDTYESFEGLRFLARVPLSILRKAHSRFLRLVNPQQLPHLYTCDRARAFDLFFISERVEHDPDSTPTTDTKKAPHRKPESPEEAAQLKVLHSLCDSLTSHNGQIDVLDVFAGVCMLGRAESSDQLRFLFHLFDLSETGEVSEDELVLIFRSVQWFSCQIGMVQDTASAETLEKVACEIIQKYGDRTQETVDLDQFQRALTEGKELLGSFGKILEFVQVWARSFFQIEEKVDMYGKEVVGYDSQLVGSNNSTTANVGDTTGPTPNQGVCHQVPFATAPVVSKQSDTPLCWGPVAFPSSSTDVRILFKASAEAIVRLYVCLDEHKDHVTSLVRQRIQQLLPPLEGHPHLYQTQVLQVKVKDYGVPVSLVVGNLFPGTRYTIVLAGAAQSSPPPNSPTRTDLPRVSFVTPGNEALSTCIGAMVERACLTQPIPEVGALAMFNNGASQLPSPAPDARKLETSAAVANDVRVAIAKVQQWWLPKLSQATKGLLPSGLLGVLVEPTLSRDVLCDRLLANSHASDKQDMEMLVDGLLSVAISDREAEKELLLLGRESEGSNSRPATPTSIREDPVTTLPEQYVAALDQMGLLLSSDESQENLRAKGSLVDNAAVASHESNQLGLLWQQGECRVVRLTASALAIVVLPGQTCAATVAKLRDWLAAVNPTPQSLLLMSGTPLLGAQLPRALHKLMNHARSGGADLFAQCMDGNSIYGTYIYFGMYVRTLGMNAISLRESIKSTGDDDLVIVRVFRQPDRAPSTCAPYLVGWYCLLLVRLLVRSCDSASGCPAIHCFIHP